VILALSVVVSLAGKSLLKGLTSAAVGALVALVGIDPTSGLKRFTLGNTELIGGIDFIAVIIWLFAIAEVLRNVEEKTAAISTVALKNLLPRMKELRECVGTMLRATGVGFVLGILPGCTPGAISFIAYDLERRISKNKEQFGKGAIQGVAAPEGANNATTSGGFVPLLALGIPPTPALAVLLSGFMIYGLQPGPLLFEKQPQFVWTVIASMYVGNVMLLVLNLPLVGIWARMASIPYSILSPIILLFSFIGSFSVRNNMFDVGTAIFFGGLGYLMEKVKIPTTPMVLSLILVPMLESSLRQSLSMTAGSPILLVTRPLALVFILAGVLLVLITLAARARKPKKERM
jgi:putative tricarboxylic transport membrane protein